MNVNNKVVGFKTGTDWATGLCREAFDIETSVNEADDMT